MSGRLSGHHVAVLMGGLSPERDVSLVTGAASGLGDWPEGRALLKRLAA